MSNLRNTELEERAYETFCEAASEDSDFGALLANTFLEGMENYLFFKDCAWDYLGNNLEDYFEYILKWDWEETVRNPIEAAYQYAKKGE